VKIFSETERLPQFKRDIKKLLRKYKTLEEDLENFIRAHMQLYHKLGKNIQGIEQIPGLGFTYPKIYKATKFACRSLKGKGARSGIRVIYAYFEEEDRIELIEIYYKGDKENEDRDRIINKYKINT